MREMLGSWFDSLLCFTTAAAAVTFTTLQPRPEGIIDYGHALLPHVSSQYANAAVVLLVTAALGANPKKFVSAVQSIYIQGLLIKATLILPTLIPDSDPGCETLGSHCMTRNDMLPSGHMLAAVTAASVLGTRGAQLGAAVCGLLLISSRMHYSVDVVLSAWLGTLLWQLSACQDALDKGRWQVDPGLVYPDDWRAMCSPGNRQALLHGKQASSDASRDSPSNELESSAKEHVLI